MKKMLSQHVFSTERQTSQTVHRTLTPPLRKSNHYYNIQKYMFDCFPRLSRNKVECSVAEDEHSIFCIGLALYGDDSNDLYNKNIDKDGT